MRDDSEFFSMKEHCRYPQARILIVEDDPDQLNYICYTLRKAGYSDITTCDSASAVSVYQDILPDVFLLNHNMPNCTGIEIVNTLSACFPGKVLPVIMITAETNNEIKLKALTAGIQDFVNKPFDQLELLARVNTVIAANRSHRDLENEKIELDKAITKTRTSLDHIRYEKRKMEKKLEFIALHDNLTGLPNKSLFSGKMKAGLQYCKHDGKFSSLFILNVDNIKTINNTLGHEYGDTVLVQLSRELISVIHSSDSTVFLDPDDYVISRFSGNSFAIGVLNLDDEQNYTPILDRFIRVLESPLKLGDIEIVLNYSIGVVHYPTHGHELEKLLKRADVASYNAKKMAHQYLVYDDRLDEFTEFNLSLMQQLKTAITNDALELHLQPKVMLSTNRIYAFEVLLRWNHPQHGYIPPDKFISIAEEIGQMHSLTRWVVHNSIKIIERHRQALAPQSISINVTASDLLNDSLIADIMETMIRTDTAETITLEITESTMVVDPERVLQAIEKFSNRGVSFSIDDFGTGYSSLSYLQKLPVNELKIDRSFVMDLNNNRDNEIIVKSIIDIAHHLNMNVVAEGVENIESLNLLRDLNCDAVQGYYISRPVPVEEAIALAERYNAKTCEHTDTNTYGGTEN